MVSSRACARLHGRIGRMAENGESRTREVARQSEEAHDDRFQTFGTKVTGAKGWRQSGRKLSIRGPTAWRSVRNRQDPRPSPFAARLRLLSERSSPRSLDSNGMCLDMDRCDESAITRGRRLPTGCNFELSSQGAGLRFGLWVVVNVPQACRSVAHLACSASIGHACGIHKYKLESPWR